MENIKNRANSIAKSKLMQTSNTLIKEGICNFLHEIKLAIDNGSGIDALEQRIESFAMQSPTVPLSATPIRYNNLYEIMGYWNRVVGTQRTDLTIRSDGRAWFSEYDMSTRFEPTAESDFRGPSQLIVVDEKQHLQFSGRKIEILDFDAFRKILVIRLDNLHEPITLNNFSPAINPLWLCQGKL